MIEAAEALLRPVGQHGRLVVEEQAAVLDGRLFHDARTERHAERAVMRDRHVGPPVPGRDADLFRQRVDPVDRAALVAAGDDQRALHAGHRVRDRLDDEAFPLAGQRARVDLALLREAVDQAVAPERAHDDHVARRRRTVDLPRRGLARHAADVALQVARSAQHAGILVRADDDGRGTSGLDQRDAGLALRVDEPRRADGVDLAHDQQSCHCRHKT